MNHQQQSSLGVAVLATTLASLSFAAPTSSQELAQWTSPDVGGDLDVAAGPAVALFGDELFVACNGPRVCVVSTATGELLDELWDPDAGAVSATRFGDAVAVDANRVVVGDPSDNTLGTNSGAAYVFDRESSALLFELSASDTVAEDYFGAAVAIDGDLAIVGAPDEDDFSGAAYVFDLTTGNELFKLKANDMLDSRGFGHDVAIAGNFVVVSAPYPGILGDGAAYAFELGGGTQIARFVSDQPFAFDEFGESVATNGTVAAIGAHFENDAGAVYLFDLATSSQIAKLTASDAAFADAFGFDVDFDRDTLVVGAPSAGPNNNGSLYVFDAATGSELAQYTTPNLNTLPVQNSGGLGRCVDVDNGRVAAFATFSEPIGGTEPGSAHVFELADGAIVYELFANDLPTGDRFGDAVAGQRKPRTGGRAER